MAVGGRAHPGAGQVQLGFLQRRLGGLQVGPRHVRQAGGLLALLGGHRPAQAVAAGGFVAAQFRLQPAVLQFGPGLVQGQPVAFRIHHEQRVALRHPGVVAHVQPGNRPGHVRRHLNHRRAHPGVAGPQGVHVLMPEKPHRQGRAGHQHQGD